MSSTSAVTVIDAALALESSLEDKVEDISELILRGMELSSLDEQLSLSLGKNLTTLSLSHNNFKDLDHFGNMLSLQDLNMNFNALSSSCVHQLAGLVSLRSLYLSNNNLDEAAMKSFSSLSLTNGAFSNLEVLCLFSNKISSLELCMECVSALSSLRDCSFDGNECSSKPGYRTSIIRSTKNLRMLDGEDVESFAFDIDPARPDRKPRASAAARVPKLNFGGIAKRKGGECNDDDVSTAFGGLNSDPILLTYRAATVLGHDATGIENDGKLGNGKDGRGDEGMGFEDDGNDEDDDNYDCETDRDGKKIAELAANLEASKANRGLVGRLRGKSARGLSEGSGGKKSMENGANYCKENEGARQNESGVGDIDITAAAAMLNVHGVPLADLKETKGSKKGERAAAKAQREQITSVDMTADPWEIVRKLLVKCETLESENKALKRHQRKGGECGGSLSKEFESMKLEMER